MSNITKKHELKRHKGKFTASIFGEKINAMSEGVMIQKVKSAYMAAGKSAKFVAVSNSTVTVRHENGSKK